MAGGDHEVQGPRPVLHNELEKLVDGRRRSNAMVIVQYEDERRIDGIQFVDEVPAYHLCRR